MTSLDENRWTADDMVKLGSGIRDAFGAGYTYEQRHEHYGIIRKNDDPDWGIGLFCAAYETKVTISGVYPVAKDKSCVSLSRENAPSIGVSKSRAATAIVADVKRRFLPDYEQLLAQYKDRVTARNDYLDRQTSITQRFATLTGGNVHDGNRITGLYRQGPHIDSLYISVDKETVDIKFHNLPADKAEEIIRLLNLNA